MRWEHKKDDPRRFHHWREDGWSVYLLNEQSLTWQLCAPNGDKFMTIVGFKCDQLNQLLAKATEEIANLQRPSTGLHTRHPAELL